MGKREKGEGASVRIQRAKELKVSVVGRMDGKKGQEEMKVEGRNRKCKREDNGKPCLAPNREEKQEAVAVTERDTAKTKPLKLSQETVAKCEVLFLLHVPQTSNPPHTAHSPPWAELSCSQGSSPAKAHTRIKSA